MSRTILFSLACSTLACSSTPAPPHVQPRGAAAADDGNADSVEAIVDPIIQEALAREGIPGAAFVFVKEGRIVLAKSYGFADQEQARAADETTLWPLASVTKVFTAVAALQLVDRGVLALDQPIDRALRRIRTPASYGAPITLAHLLSHEAGFDELPGRQFDPVKGPAPELAEFLRDRLKPYREPGQLATYSTYGIALAAVAVEDASGMSFPDFLQQHLLAPCEMHATRMMRQAGDEAGVAVPYEVGGGRSRRVPYEWYVTQPASSLVATVGDVARFMMMHLNDGRCGSSQVLSEGLARAMRAQQSTIHPRIPGWGYGFQIDGENSRWLAEHGGDIAGFSSLMTIIPAERAGFFIVSHGEGNDLRFRVKQALMDRLYPDCEPRPVPLPDPRDSESLKEYAGRYRSSLACHTCGESRGDFELLAHEDGTLELWNQRWLPIGPDLFTRVDGERLLAFTRNGSGRVAVVSGGSWRVAERVE
jgi:CubicO group peptidase (beta-lactamase class C family)